MHQIVAVYFQLVDGKTQVEMVYRFINRMNFMAILSALRTSNFAVKLFCFPAFPENTESDRKMVNLTIL